jgi:hypothetical protein
LKPVSLQQSTAYLPLLVTMNLSLFRPHAAGAIERVSGNIEPVCAVAARRLEIVRRRPGAEFGG